MACVPREKKKDLPHQLLLMGREGGRTVSCPQGKKGGPPDDFLREKKGGKGNIPSMRRRKREFSFLTGLLNSGEEKSEKVHQKRT